MTLTAIGSVHYPERRARGKWTFWDQTMTAQQTLDVVAANAAAVGDAQHRGRLVPGSYADITILSGDITSGTPAEIRRLEVVATIVGGIAEFCTRPGDLPLTGSAAAIHPTASALEG